MNDDLPLGRSVAYPTCYDPSVLRRIERRVSREEIGIRENLPFTGEDVWNCYELSWLAPSGLPRVGVLSLRVPAESPCIVESKSLKLYLNGLSGATFEDADDVAAVIETDLSKKTGSAVRVAIRSVGDLDSPRDFTSFCLDGQPVSTSDYQHDPDLLTASAKIGADAIHTHLFRTVCPITGQPDWGSVAVAYHGYLLDRASVLRYLVSYRETADFHEVVAERLFIELQEASQATDLTVHALFLRRGGIDINPYRSTSRSEAPRVRLPRQ